MANGVAHPLLAVQARAYFPVLSTSPLVGLVGVVLWRRLDRVHDARLKTHEAGLKTRLYEPAAAVFFSIRPDMWPPTFPCCHVPE